MAAEGAAATPSPGDDRRKKLLLQKKKAKEGRPETPEQKEPSPASRKSTAYVSLCRKQIIEKRRNKAPSPSDNNKKIQSPVDEEKKEQSPPKNERGATAPFPEMASIAAASSSRSHETHLNSSSQDSTDFINRVPENTAPEEDRNDKVDSGGAWDTRSIHEFPPEPAFDPTWDASKTVLFTSQQNQDIEKQVEVLDLNEEFSMDSETFAATYKLGETRNVKDVDCSLDVGVGTTDDELANDAARLIGVSEEYKEKEKARNAQKVVSDELTTDTALKHAVDYSIDVHVGVHNDDTMVSHAHRLLTGNEENTQNDQVDFSATDLNNPLNILNDAEALLELDQIRSDVADGAESNTADAIRLWNQVEQQKRIEQYQSRSGEDSSSAAACDEDLEKDSEEEDFDKEDEVIYISADSEEEEDLARHLNAADVSEILVDMTGEGATFAAAAESAALGANSDASNIELNNDGLTVTNASSFGSFRADSTVVASSVASSAALFGGVLSTAETSVITDVTASSSSKGPTIRMVDSNPPPPPSSQPPPKKKYSKGSKKKRRALPKIPPPPPEKLKKWEDDKLRPIKHLQAVANAKAKSTEVKSEPEFPLEDTPASEYVSLPLITSISTSHSQDEIETSLAQSLPQEHSAMMVDAECNGRGFMFDQANELDESQRSAILNESQMTHRTLNSTTSYALLSPPHVSRTKLEEASGLAPGNDGVWKDDSNKKKAKKKKSPLSDKKMAERLAVASSTAARKFEEKYGDVDQEPKVARTMSSDSLNRRIPVDKRRTKSEDKSDLSYFCSPDILNATSFCHPQNDSVDNDDDNILSHLSAKATKTWASKDGSDKSMDPKQRSMLNSSFDDTHHAGLELVGGAFSTWKNSDYAYGSDVGAKNVMPLKDSLDIYIQAAAEDIYEEELRLLSWLENDVLGNSTRAACNPEAPDSSLVRAKLKSLLEDDKNFNALCIYVTANVSMSNACDDSSDSNNEGLRKSTSDKITNQTRVRPFLIPTDKSNLPKPSILAANFISFLNRISLLSGVESPFKDENPFLLDVVTTSMQAGNASLVTEDKIKGRTVQDLIFEHELGQVIRVVSFFYHSCGTPSSLRTSDIKKAKPLGEAREFVPTKDAKVDVALPVEETMHRLYKVPTQSPSPFETASWSLPSIVAIVLGFLGDPVAVCRVKMLNHFCNRLIQENEHVIMRDAVRLGGIGMHIRPAFWMWITLEKCRRSSNAADASRNNEQRAHATDSDDTDDEQKLKCITTVLPQLEQQGREGKWHHVIQRDVARAFGNMPPHKTGARLRTDSIVRALVTWGRGRVLSRGVKGGGVSSPTPLIPPPGIEKAKSKPRPATGPPPWERGDGESEKVEDAQGPPDTVSQWSGISPVPSFCSNSGVSESGSAASRANLVNGVAKALEKDSSGNKELKNSRAIEELALCGNTLTAEMKEGLQNQLGYILHALAAAHEDVGYCQGMDYVVAHLLRVLQDTVRWHSVRGTLSPVIKAQPKIPESDSDEQSLTKEIDQAIESSLVVEETVFRVMDTFLTTYSLRHMYFPELRCLKTCCRVFERLIQMKLPVLADHFAYHELNVGLFALGWFQTLFLYLPSMPSATVCHMWDIWLVERSFKIFFRVGTAILFFSQPILLNHELEGMMTYLNTFPDATLLNPDILIACALQIKVTNRMLAEIERDLTGGY